MEIRLTYKEAIEIIAKQFGINFENVVIEELNGLLPAENNPVVIAKVKELCKTHKNVIAAIKALRFWSAENKNLFLKEELPHGCLNLLSSKNLIQKYKE